MFKPKHKFGSVVRELRDGLNNGSITLDKKADTSGALLPISFRHAAALGLDLGKSEVEVCTFFSNQNRHNFLTKTNVTTEHLVVTVAGHKVIHVSGDVSEIQSFDIPPHSKIGLAELLSGTVADLLKTESHPTGSGKSFGRRPPERNGSHLLGRLS